MRRILFISFRYKPLIFELIQPVRKFHPVCILVSKYLIFHFILFKIKRQKEDALCKYVNSIFLWMSYLYIYLHRYLLIRQVRIQSLFEINFSIYTYLFYLKSDCDSYYVYYNVLYGYPQIQKPIKNVNISQNFV